MAAQNDVQTRFQVFAKDTSFHGFRELSESQRTWQKWIWIFIIIASTAVFCYQANGQAQKFLDGQVGVRVGKLTVDQYIEPTIFVLIPRWFWVNMSKVKEYNITIEEHLVAKSYLYPVFAYFSEVPVNEAKESLKYKLKLLNITSIIDYFHSISNDLFDYSDTRQLVTAKRVGWEGHSCLYTLNNSEIKKPIPSSASQLEFAFNFSSYHKNLREHFDSGEFGREEQRLSIMDSYLRTQNPPAIMISHHFQPIWIAPLGKYTINTDMRIQKRLYECDNQHNSDPFYDAGSCKFKCEMLANASVNASDCVVYERYRMTWITSIPVPLCSQGIKVNNTKFDGIDKQNFRILTKEEENSRRSQLEECQKQCLPACEQRRITVSISTFELALEAEGNNDSTISVYFQNLNTISVTEEILDYSWLDLISDIGGLLGLWLGASMMSLFQMVHLFFVSPNGKVQMNTVQMVNVRPS